MRRAYAAVAALVLLASALAACSQTMRVKAQVDRAAHWQGYRTYNWASDDASVFATPRRRFDADQLDQLVRSAVDAQLAAKGYAKDAFGTPDFLVSYRLDFRETNAESFQDYYWYKRTGGEGSLQDAFVMGYDEGTLSLELTTPGDGWIIWRAQATAVADRKTQQTQIDEAARLMCQRLPASGTVPQPAED